MRPCDAVAKRQLPCGSFKMFKISASEFRTMGMCRQMQACTDEFLATVPEDVIHSVYKVVTQSSFGITLQLKASGGKCVFCHHVTSSHTNLTQ